MLSYKSMTVDNLAYEIIKFNLINKKVLSCVAETSLSQKRHCYRHHQPTVSDIRFHSYKKSAYKYIDINFCSKCYYNKNIV